MSKLNDSFVEIELRGETRRLIASPEALLAASRYDNGLAALYSHVNRQNVDAYLFLLKIGLQCKEKEVKDLPALLFESGVAAVSAALLKYVFMLQNGGKALDESDAEADEGNA